RQAWLHQARGPCVVLLASSQRRGRKRGVLLLLSVCLCHRFGARNKNHQAAQQPENPNTGDVGCQGKSPCKACATAVRRSSSSSGRRKRLPALQLGNQSFRDARKKHYSEDRGNPTERA